jgi:hypothetical protein
MRIETLPGNLGRLLVAAMLVTSGRSECQQTSSQDAADVDAAQDGCRSIVMVHCARAQQDAPANTGSADPRRATQQRLDARRLRQMQAQAGLNAVEVTGERPPEAESDPWEGFRQSMASAAVPECFSSNAARHGAFAAQGLLALPFLVHAAATGKCR